MLITSKLNALFVTQKHVRFIFSTLLVGLLFFSGASTVLAAVTVTSATGGSSISADTTGGTYTSLTGPVIEEAATGDIGTGTIILNVPSGFQFDTGGTAPTVLVTRTGGGGNNNRNINDLPSGSTIAVGVTSTTLTITVTASTSNGVRNSLTWQNVRVRPTAGSPLASGNITKSGTSVISGVTDGVTNFGTLTEVVGAFDHFTFAAIGQQTTAIPFSITMTAKDAHENTITSYTGTVDLSTNAGTILPAISGTFAGGVRTESVTVSRAGTNKTITAVDHGGTKAGVSNTFTVNPEAVKFVIEPPGSGTVDAPVTVTVKAEKADDSIDTNYQQGVTVHTTGSATGSGLVMMVNGVGTIAISDTVAETITLSLADTEGTGLNVSSTQPLTFGSGVTAQYTISDVTSATAGERAAYTVTRSDQYGNPRTSGTDIVYLYSSSTGTNKRFYDAATGGNNITSITIPNGASSVTVWYYDEKAGTWTITASDNASAPDGNVGLNDAVDSLTVTPAAVAGFTLNDPGNMTAGTRLGYTVTRKDQYGNLATSGATTAYLYSSSSGTHAFYLASSGGSPVTSVTIVAGNATANIWYYDEKAGTWTITASDNASAPDGIVGIADGEDSVVVNPAPIVATRFVILPPSDGTVDAPVTVTVEAQDGSGNIDTSYTQDVTLTADGSATGAGLVNIVNGVGTLAISDTAAETVHLGLSDTEGTGLNVSSTRSVAFAPGAVAQFTLDNPGDTAAGLRIGYTLTRKDQYGNLVTAGATTAYLYSTSDGTHKKFYDAASGGSAITSLTIADGDSSGTFWAYDEKAGDWYITASDNASAPDGAAGIADASDALTVTPAAVSAFTLNDPGDMTAGTRLGYTLARKDEYGNLVTSGVTLAYLYTSSTGSAAKFYDAAMGGIPITVATVNDGQSTTNFWYYDEKAGTWTVTASDSSSGPNGAVGIVDATDEVTVSPLPIVATRFVILPAGPVQIGTPATVTVEATDDAGNIDTTYENDVTLHVTGSATGAGLVNIVNGVGTLTLNDMVAETVTLSLTDSEGTGLDVSSTGSLLFSATPVAPIGGGAGLGAVKPIAGTRISGQAFPGARVQMLAVTPQESARQAEIVASSGGAFSTTLSNIATGASAYGIVGVDSLGRVTQTKVFSVNYANPNALLTLSATLLSPTLGLVSPVVRKGDFVGFVGMATPGASVEAQVDGVTLAGKAVAAKDGSYKLLFPTADLSLGSHTVRVLQVTAGATSDYSPQKVFEVSTLFTPQTDFNQDGVINVQDWSVFLARWSSSVAATRMLDDLNGDGVLDVTDLSIFVRTLKK